MTVLVDTNVLIDHLRAREGARARVGGAVDAAEPLLASTLTKIEVLAGMRTSERASTRRLFELIDWVPVTDEIAERAGELARRYRDSHPHVELVDYAIAATAEEHDAELWTLNLRDFPMFPNLTAPY